MQVASLATVASIAELVARALGRSRSQDPLASVVHGPLDALVDEALPGVRFQPAWWAERLGLDAVDEALGWLAVAPTLALSVAQGYGVLRANPDDWTLTEAIAAELLGASGPPASIELSHRLSAASRLVELGLLERRPANNPIAASLVATSSFLTAAVALPPAVAAPARLDALVLGAGSAQALAQVTELFGASDPADPASCPALVIIGAPRSGRRLVAAHVAARLERELRSVVLDADETARARLTSAVLEARLNRQMLHVVVHAAIKPDTLAIVAHHLDRFAEVWSLALVEDRPLPRLERPVTRFDLPFPTAPERRRLFRQYLPRRLQEATALDLASHRYRIAGGDIRDVCLELGDSQTPDTLNLQRMDDAVRAHVTHNLRSRARLVRATESLTDLVASDELRLLLRVVVANYRHRRLVLDDWGFSDRFGKGLGLSALFSGPPGTGKTMAAAAVAAELGLPLYQIELSQIVSKWVGETEKALDDVFREAESASAALLFDEADSLFTKRTDVSSANDRYANLEVNHLLQRVESFTGVVLLTTNNLSVIDSAFLRRFSYHVAFPLPSETERAVLWKQLIPPRAPLQGAIRYDHLGRDFEFSGGHIKNAVIRAAYFAAELGRPIDEALLRVTASLEVKQLGGIVRDLNLSDLLA